MRREQDQSLGRVAVFPEPVAESFSSGPLIHHGACCVMINLEIKLPLDPE